MNGLQCLAITISIVSLGMALTYIGNKLRDIELVLHIISKLLEQNKEDKSK